MGANLQRRLGSEGGAPGLRGPRPGSPAAGGPRPLPRPLRALSWPPISTDGFRSRRVTRRGRAGRQAGRCRPTRRGCGNLWPGSSFPQPHRPHPGGLRRNSGMGGV